MPATDFQGSSVPFASIGRSILSIRRDSVHGVDGHHHDSPAGGASHDLELEVFQKHVSDLFHDLSSGGAGGGDDLLSLAWVRNLLDSFLICQEEFRVILFSCSKGQQQQAHLARPPLDRFLSDFFDRAVKALDLCNAIRDGVDQLRLWRQHLEIALEALHGGQPLGEGQVRRAQKALADLSILMLDEKETPSSGGSSILLYHRNRSFGRSVKEPPPQRGGGGSAASAAHFRYLTWSVSRSWSAARQLQGIGNNLYAPRGNEVSSTGGLAVPVYTMSSVLFFVMWSLVAALPCQDRGLQTHPSVPRSFMWAAPMTSMHEKIFEESKKKERKNTSGLLKEIYQMEKSSRHLTEFLDTVELPLSEEQEVELNQEVQELAEVCNAMKENLDPLERQVREVFLRIVRSRTEILELLNKSHNPE
ncbi:protein BYPASS1-LIKE-like [Curcuma longa]|uniref:protein BYPASS1-LIKE-like n=1 Tax=Curcuma longa TaxID=136217 RepID=UPI003D9EF122